MNNDVRLKFLGGCRQVGRSAVNLETDINMIMDYGVQVEHGPNANIFPLKPDKPVDIAVIAHAHMDHSGMLPALFDNGRPRVIGTPPTKSLVNLLIKDSMKLMEELPFKADSFRKALRNFHPVDIKEKIHRRNTTITLLDAGHITGSSMVSVSYNGKEIFYTSDFNTQETNNHYAAKPPNYDADVLIIESTYANREHPNRQELELRFYEEVRRTYEEGGHVLIPAFAVDRSQEVISILRKFDRKKKLPIFLDGMGRQAVDIMLKNPDYVKDFRRFRKYMKSVTNVKSQRHRERLINEPAVIVTTAGMLSGGPALFYIDNLNPKSRILITGYCVEGTNGWMLQNKGTMMIENNEVKIDLPVRYYDFSAHTGRSGLFAFVKALNPQKVFIMHGDYCEEFAEELKLEGYDAVAPEIGQEFIV
ncbi:MBL fold metallo-hydrolase [Candidatus Micrarchaeota archaeon]|nr:MBL fold metallo-hydrolase [Candidatus Micrarchaeota archaeon]